MYVFTIIQSFPVSKNSIIIFAIERVCLSLFNAHLSMLICNNIILYINSHACYTANFCANYC